ncbi:methyltransferase domain-containing protein [Flammeovirga yaeyamensis]|uniref:Methyltransferase domain-containing protein n=1 Tax=Flammeovirga yaeyamensis TaxID=367791 RepID=A0AAX1NBZ4_9BACT|nr:class I SAM-dependent methyltransferase [Flammeovirga yaeyamensis]MBB3699889.1 ubiquinone/menaquinone biosynthesis C-methylase UbiE [Flammeovirga yaeyamensis]NMF38315.1 class I SAM-dependent methyltransferase [Flammeovirga yaeyamensis]QWG04727.1 methyltransferase domain-containing protein [Flammeovirga yaeyamensis]
MKQVIDRFTTTSSTYKKFRPKYPSSIFEYICQNTKNFETALDCGTGNGQVAIHLSKKFNSVIGIDISKNQINNAESQKNIWYIESRAEVTQFKDEYFDLITVGQALHWFDLELFNKEAFRLLKKGGTIACFGYNLFKVNDEIDEMINYFYYDVIGPFWDQERKILEEEYKNVPFDFEVISNEGYVDMTVNWDLEQLYGFIHTWTSVQTYLKANPTHDPVQELMENLKNIWGENTKREVKFPIFLKLGVKG